MPTCAYPGKNICFFELLPQDPVAHGAAHPLLIELLQAGLSLNPRTSTVDYQGEKVKDGRLHMPSLSQCGKKKATGSRESHTIIRSCC